MKHKFLAVLLAAVFALGTCMGVAACGETPKDPVGSTPRPSDGNDGHTHTYTEYVSNNDATCTKDGTETAHCTYAGCTQTHKRTVEGSKLGHNLEWQAGTATCLQAGTLDRWKCLRCEKSFADSEGTIEMTVYTSDVPLGHQFTVENVCGRCGTKWEYTEGLTYTYNETTDTYAVGRNADASGDIVIPYGYNGKSVTSIGYESFRNCSGLTSVTIPDSVTSIGNYAFYKCSGLESITIPDGVTEIGSFAFENCSGLTSVTIESGVTEIGSYAFYKCSGLEKVIISNLAAWCEIDFGNDTANPLYYAHHLYLDNAEVKDLTIPAEVSEIKYYAFEYCTELKTVTIESGVTEIGSRAFYKCSGLTSVTIGSGVTSIGMYAFDSCSGLVNIIIPDSVTSIGMGAFSGTAYYNDATRWDSSGVLYIGSHLIKAKTTLTGAYTIKFGTKTIAGAAFFDCSGLTGITIPNSVTSIGASAFEKCNGLESVTIPDSVTTTGVNVFYNCANLKSVTIGRGLTHLYGLFDGCTGLESITIPDSVTKIGLTAFAGCDKLTSVTIPDSVIEIGLGAFAGCGGLTSVVIPNSVTSIGSRAFYGCSVLTDIQFKGTVAEWQAIEKGSDWDRGAGDYTVTCTNGTVDKDGNVT